MEAENCSVVEEDRLPKVHAIRFHVNLRGCKSWEKIELTHQDHVGILSGLPCTT